jgi:hypothetical protein
MVIFMTGIVCADPVVPAVPETQALSTVTTADVAGLVMETDAVAWTLSNGTQIYTAFGNGFYYPTGHPEWLAASDSYQYTTAYDANIVAHGGLTAFTKTMNVDTRNKVISQSNINAKTGLTFAATADGGNVVGSENLMIDGVGDSMLANGRFLCPFATQPDNVIPSFCNIVQAGSKYDLTIGSVTTDANDRFVGSDATNPVVLNYDISVKPYGTSQGQIPAIGSSMAYIKLHLQEGQNQYIYADVDDWSGPLKAEDLTYSEVASAQGTITAFNKVMAYQSGKALL